MIYRDRKRQGLLRSLKRIAVALGTAGAVLAAGTPAAAAVSTAPDRTAGFNGTVWATAYSGNTVYVAGDFTAALVGTKLVTRNRLAAIDATTGALLPWAPSANARVKALAVSGGSVYAAGEFTAISGVSRDSLARIDANNAAVHSTFKHSILGKPYALAAANGRLYLGGAITGVDGQTRTRLAAFNLSTGVLDASWKPVASDQVETIVATAGRVYLGGKFHTINGVSGTARIAAVNPSSGGVDTTFRSRASVITYGIALTSAGVVAAHGGQGGKVVSYDYGGAIKWSATFDGDPQAVALLGGTLYVGGHFDNICTTSRTGDQGFCVDGAVSRVKLAALDVADGDLQPWTAHGNGVVGVVTMAVSPALGTLAAGGAFTTINGVTQKRFVQFG